MTNGVTDTQKRRIAQLEFKISYLGIYIRRNRISKPMSEFLIISLRKEKTSIIVGDSLTSDILGGKMLVLQHVGLIIVIKKITVILYRIMKYNLCMNWLI